MTPAEAEKERLLDAMEESLACLGWVGHMDEYETICKLIRAAIQAQLGIGEKP